MYVYGINNRNNNNNYMNNNNTNDNHNHNKNFLGCDSIEINLVKKFFFCRKLNKKSFSTSVSIAGVISRLAMTVVATISTIIFFFFPFPLLSTFLIEGLFVSRNLLKWKTQLLDL